MSHCQTLLRQLLDSILLETPLENYRPSWMQGLELDLYYPRCRLAFEFQGDQHFEAGIFGDKDELSRQKARDKLKKRICKGYHIELRHVIATELTVSILWNKILWKRGIYNRLKQQKLIRNIHEARAIGHATRKRAKKHRKYLQERFDSATTYYGEARQAAMERHEKNQLNLL